MSEEKDKLNKESATLSPCPFCGGKAKFVMDKSDHVIITHEPEAGVCCPARLYQVCDPFDCGRLWWNTRR